MRQQWIAGVVGMFLVPSLAFAQSGAASPANARAEKPGLTRVTGIGGIFIKARDPKALRAWYRLHLGIEVQVWGGTSFRWTDATGKPTPGTTDWMVGDGKNFAPSDAPFMVNYRVADLYALLAALRAEGCNVLEKTEESAYGKFGWVMDPEGNKIELWEPPAGS